MEMYTFFEWLRRFSPKPGQGELSGADAVQARITAAGSAGIRLSQLRAGKALPYQILLQLLNSMLQAGLVVLIPTSDDSDPVLRSRF